MTALDRTASQDRLGQPKRIALFRALHLGDLLCAVPALRALRAACPDAEIALVGLPSARDFVERFRRYLDRLLEFPGYPGLSEQPFDARRTLSFFAIAQAQEFDLAIQMHGGGFITNPLTLMLGARQNGGFYLPGHHCPDAHRFLPYPEYEPEPWRHLRLMEFLGVPPAGIDLEFPLEAADWDALEAVDAAARLRRGEYVCLHPGGREPLRRWPAEQFAAVGDALAAEGLQVVVTGTEDERPLTRRVVAAMRQPAIDLAGRTDLGALGALVAGARLVVCNDTGVSHLAAALRTPSVVVFVNSDANRWAPLDLSRHRAVWHDAGSHRNGGSRNGHHRNGTNGARAPSTVEAVLREARNLLEREAAHAA